MPAKGTKVNEKSVNSRGKTRPHVWCTGPDPLIHDMYHPWQLSKAQAKFRHEDWDFSFDEYVELWKNDWHKRGRKIDDLCMTRDDPELGWFKGNVYLITRAEHLKQQAGNRKGKTVYSKLKVQK